MRKNNKVVRENGPGDEKEPALPRVVKRGCCTKVGKRMQDAPG